jgi:lipoprotein NlpI
MILSLRSEQPDFADLLVYDALYAISPTPEDEKIVMKTARLWMPVVLGSFLATTPDIRAADTPADLLLQARSELEQGHKDKAMELASKALALDPRYVPAYLFRGALKGALGRHAEAVTEFTQALSFDPRFADAYHLRGAEHFKLGHIAESIADFDKFLELKPAETPGHWMRGISYYYAGRYEEGAKQFSAYENVDTNDVENAIWHYLCNAKKVGPEKARAALLKIGQDQRVPMMPVYALFQGRAKPADVLAAAAAAKMEEQKRATFLAHLYLGLYYDSIGDAKQAIDHLTQAAKSETGGYMADVARVHLMLKK